MSLQVVRNILIYVICSKSPEATFVPMLGDSRLYHRDYQICAMMVLLQFYSPMILIQTTATIEIETIGKMLAYLLCFKYFGINVISAQVRWHVGATCTAYYTMVGGVDTVYWKLTRNVKERDVI